MSSQKISEESLSYARCAETRAGRAVIRGIENLSGRKRLIRSLAGYENEMATGKTFWEVFWERFGFKLEADGVGLEGIPKNGPLVCVANHPFGIVDALTFCMILAKTRPDFKILSNEWLVPAPEMMHHVLPIDREPTRAAMETNLKTRREAISLLKDGGCISVFPAGTVSQSRRIYKRAFDANWKNFTATLIQMTGAQVTPIFFDGQNSRLYQIASHLSETLRIALAVNEFDRMIGGPVKVTIGETLDQRALEPYYGKPEAMMTYLRSLTYSLSPDFVNALTRGKAWG